MVDNDKEGEEQEEDTRRVSQQDLNIHKLKSKLALPHAPLRLPK